MLPNQAAFLIGHKKKPLVVDVAEDRYPDETEIVIENAAIAINQIDWKTQNTPWKTFAYPMILGVDVAGKVVGVGSDARFRIGDRVLGHALSLATEDERHAGFQKYTVLMSNMASLIPPSLTFEEAAVLPLGVSTASAALFQEDCLSLPPPSLKPTKTSTTVLIWGGTSSVGSNAIQLAVAAGCDVIATASQRNFDAVRRRGAALVVDYSSKSVIEDLKKAFEGRTLAGAFDAIGTPKTFEQTLAAVSQINGNRVVVSTIDDRGEVQVPEGVRFELIQAIDIRESTNSRGDNIGRMVYEKYLPAALAAKKYHIAPEPSVVGQGLASIQTALDTALKIALEPSNPSSKALWDRKLVVTIK